VHDDSILIGAVSLSGTHMSVLKKDGRDSWVVWYLAGLCCVFIRLGVLHHLIAAATVERNERIEKRNYSKLIG